MPHNFTIRESLEEDFELIFQIWMDNQAEATGHAIADSAINCRRGDLKRLFRMPDSKYYVAVSGSGRVIGWQSIMPLLSNPTLSKHIAQSSTYVEVGNVNRNIGTMLLAEALRGAKKKGFEQVYGWIRSDHAVANQFALRFGTLRCHIPGSVSGNVPDFNLYVVDL